MLIAVVAIVTGLVLASEIVLILFLGVLFGVFLTRVSAWLSEKLSVPRGICLVAVVAGLGVAGLGGTVSFFVQINHQFQQASEKVDEGVDELREVVEQYPTVRSIVRRIPFISDTLIGGPSSGPSSETEQGKDQQENSSARPITRVPQPVRSAAESLGGLFQTTLGLLVNSLLIFFVGLFIAMSPESYRDGAVSLVSPARRPRATQVLDAIGESLWRWLIGRFGSMLVTGVGASLLLLWIGVPMAGTLGFITAMLTFVPNIGAAVSLLLAMLFALPQGLQAVGMVFAAYMLLQLLESYVVSPLIQQKHASLPPALLIASQAIMGVLFGFMGAAVASPMLATIKKSVEMLYIEDILEAD